MPDNLELSAQQIARTSKILGLEEFVIEKDFYVTRLIHALSDIKNDYYHLVFQGGTALSKAHQIIPRMSEDVDFRIAYRSQYDELGRHARRKKLQDFRHGIMALIQKKGFGFKEKPRVYYEGGYTVLKLTYDSIYHKDTASSLKPHISLDLFVSQLKTPTVEKPVTTLIKETLGEAIVHPIKILACMSLTETAAEKWVGLTSRMDHVKEGKEKASYSLVRHIYDLHKIHQKEPLPELFEDLVHQILTSEAQKFNQSDHYVQNHVVKTQRVLQELQKPIWKENWQQFMRDMVFEVNPPPYEKALINLQMLSRSCLKYLERSKTHTRDR